MNGPDGRLVLARFDGAADEAQVVCEGRSFIFLSFLVTSKKNSFNIFEFPVYSSTGRGSSVLLLRPGCINLRLLLTVREAVKKTSILSGHVHKGVVVQSFF